MTNIYLRFGKIWKCWPQKVAGHTPFKNSAFSLVKKNYIYITFELDVSESNRLSSHINEKFHKK